MALGPFQWQHPHSGTIFQRTLGNHPRLVLLNLDSKHRCLKLYLIPRFFFHFILYTLSYLYFGYCSFITYYNLLILEIVSSLRLFLL